MDGHHRQSVKPCNCRHTLNLVLVCLIVAPLLTNALEHTEIESSQHPLVRFLTEDLGERKSAEVTNSLNSAGHPPDPIDLQPPPCPSDESIAPCVCNSSKKELICRGSTESSGVKLRQAFIIFSRLAPPNQLYSISINLRDLVTLENGIFAGIRFSTIFLTGNNLTFVGRDAFRGTDQSVESLFIFKTRLTNYEPQYDFFAAVRSLSNLKLLTVNSNFLIDIPDRAFSNDSLTLRNLKEISLSNGTIATIGSDAFVSLSQLENLGLTKNWIQRIKPYAFRTNYTSNKTLLIDLTDNSLNETSFEQNALLGAKRPVKISFGLGGCNPRLTTLPEAIFRPFLDEDSRNSVDVGRECMYIVCDCRMAWTLANSYTFRVKNFRCLTKTGVVQYRNFMETKLCDPIESTNKTELVVTPPTNTTTECPTNGTTTPQPNDSTTESKYDNTTVYCQSKKCAKLGTEMSNYLNRSIDACESFYDYACNGWENNHLLEYLLQVLSNGGSEYDNFVKVRLRIEENLDRLLTLDVEKTKPTLYPDFHTINTSLEERERHTHQNLLPLINTKFMYQSCVSPGKGPNHEALQLIIHDIGGWPLLTKKFDPTYQWETHFVTIFNKYKDNIFIELESAVNENSTKHLMIKSGTFVVSKRKLLSVKLNRLEHYANYMLATATHFGATNYQNETLNEIWEVIRFEKQIANIAKKNIGTEFMIERNLETIGCLIQEINWLNILFNVQKHHNVMEESTFVHSKAMYDVHYLIDLSRLLNRTDRRIIANYLGWRVVESFGFLIGGSAFVDIQQNFYSTESREGTKLIKKQCLEPISRSLPYLTTRIYLYKHLPLHARKNAKKIIDSVKHSFIKSMSTKTWIDEKEELLKRVQHIQVNIGYPDWILEDKQLIEHYSLLNYTRDNNTAPDDLIRFYSKIQEIRIRHMLMDIGEKMNKARYWDPLPLYVGASYDIVDNIISIPMGLLQPPFFEDDRPFYLNFPSLGSFFGHELSHSVTPRYTEFERLLPPWTDHFLKEYLNKAQCFVSQYTSYYDKTAEQHLDGMRTFEEDMSDLAGLQAAFNAYHDNAQNSKEVLLRLQELPDLSTDMLFFLSFAQKWCRSNSRVQTRLKISKSVHSPEKYRVNGALSNLEAFAKAFNCSVGTTMNPVKKCESW